MSVVRWTKEEEQVLIDFYQRSGGIAECQRRLPHRTGKAIRTHACRLGLGQRERAAAYFKLVRQPLFRRKAA